MRKGRATICHYHLRLYYSATLHFYVAVSISPNIQFVQFDGKKQFILPLMTIFVEEGKTEIIIQKKTAPSLTAPLLAF